MALVFGSGPVAAVDLYWDGDGSETGNNTDGTNLGGSGFWDTESAGWWNLSSLINWPDNSTTSAVFTSPFPTSPYGIPEAQAITVDAGGVTANRLRFLRSGFALSGGAITLGGANAGLHANLGEYVTISNNLLGSDGLLKSGGGMIRLTGDNSGLSGTLTIADGALVVNSALAIPGSGAISVITGNLTPSNTSLFSLPAGSLVLDGRAGGFTVSRDLNLEGRGPIGERGSAILGLGNNTLSGTVTSAVSDLVPDTFRNTRISNVNGTLDLTGTIVSLGTAGTASGGTYLNFGGTNSAGVGNFNLTGVLSGSGSIEKSGAGTLILNPSDVSGFGGKIRVSGSSTGQQSSVRVTALTVGGVSVFGTNTGTNSGGAIDMNGGLLEFRFDGDLDFNSLSSGKNVYQRANSTYFTGPAVGGEAINGVTSLGTLRTAANTTGTFNSRNGFGFTLGTWSPESSNNNNTITNNLGGLLTFTGNVWGNSDAGNRTVTFGGNGNTYVQGSINTSGTGVKSLVKGGSGLLTLQGTGTALNGNISVNNGALAITDFRSVNNNGAVINLGASGTGNGAGALLIGTTATPSATGLVTSKVINLNGTTQGASIYANQSGVNPVVFNADFTATGAGAKTLTLGGTNTLDNVINGAIVNSTAATSLLKVGSGTWALAGANTYTGTTTLANGTLKLLANGAVSSVLPVANAVSFNVSNGYAGATFDFVGQDGTANVQNLGTLSYGAGANTLRLTPGAGGSASLVFANLATTGAATLNIVGSDGSSTVTVSQVNGSAPATGILTRSVYWNGADFAYSQAGVLRAPVYGVDAGTATTALGPLVSGANNELTGSIGTNSISVATLKIAGNETLTINSGQTLTLSGGGLLATGGNALVTGGTVALGTQVFVVRTNQATDTLTLESVITGSGGMTKSGDGMLILAGASARTGTTSIDAGTVRLAPGGVLSGNNATTNIRQGAILDLNGNTTGTSIGQFNNNGTVTNSSASPATLVVGNNNGTGTSRGIVSDGLGVTNVTKVGTGNQSWLGESTYTGVTTIGSNGLVTLNTLANGGMPSGIGASTSDAANLVFAGATGGLVYAGSIVNGNLTLGSRSASTDRLFTLAGTGATLSSTASNNNAIVWSNNGDIVHGITGPQTLVFTGTSRADNTFNPRLTDSGTGTDITSVTKTGTGHWNLGNSNNTYTGITTIGNGVLALNRSGALPANSPLALGITTTSGVLQTSGVFERALAAAAVPGSNTVTWTGTTGGGGFAAHTTPLVVAIGGAGSPTPLTWGADGFVGTGGTQSLIFGSTAALSHVEFRNPIDLGGANRSIAVTDNTNTGLDFAEVSGTLSGAGGSLTKNSNGVLKLSGANTYTGTTTIAQGTLVVTSLGNSASPGQATSIGLSTDANLSTHGLILGRTGNSGGILQYVGDGETSDRFIQLAVDGGTGSSQIHADGAGPLILTNVNNTASTTNKTLFLRGSNTAGNMITSVLANNTGTLGITVDGGATWILTNGANSYTGTTTVSGGALGIGHDSAIGGAMTVSNGNVFAYGADRTFSNTLNLNNNATSAFLGDYSLTFAGTNNLAAGANNVTLLNSIAPGKALVFQGLQANALTGNRTWSVGGNGETVINGAFTTSTTFGVNLTYSGNGILNLGTNGATSNWNQNNGVLDIDRGTLKFSANEAIPTAAPTNGGLTLSPEIATTDTATVDFNGTTQSVNALTAISNGTVVLDNTSATPATFRFGKNDAAVDFGSGLGSYTITDSGAGALSIVKLGSAAASFSSGVNLSYEGATRVEGGSLVIGASVNGTTALEVVNSGSVLALNGGIGSPSSITSVVVGDGATLSLLDGAGSAINQLTNLQLGSTGGTLTTLSLNVGDGTVAGDNLNTDRLSLLSGGTLGLFSGNQVVFNLTDLGLSGSQTYTLLSVPGGGLTTGGPLNPSDWLLGATPGGFTSITLNVTDTLIQIQTGTLVTGTSYWRGATDLTWNGNANNWSTDKTGLTPASTIPGAGTDVVFAWDGIGGGSLVTSLEQNFRVNSLTFEAGATTPASVTIDPGVSPTNRLDVAPQTSSDGIRITAGGPAAATISGPVRIGADQTWSVADSGSVLSIGSLFGEADVTKTGAGKVTLTAAADATFNSGATSSFTISAGTLELLDAAALGNTVNANLANVTIGAGGAFYLNNATSATVGNNLVLDGGTLSVGGNNHTYSGTVTVNSDSVVNLRNANGGTGEIQERNITLTGVLSGGGNLTVESDLTLSGGNAIAGALVISNPGNSGWSGDLNIKQGNVIARSGNADALGTGAINIELGKVEWEGAGGDTYVINKPLTVASLTGNAIAEWNIDRTSGTGTFKVNNTGALTLGSAAGTGELRFFLADTAVTEAEFSGPVTLANDAIMNVRNNVLSLATVSGNIGETGGSRSLAVNSLGTWGGTGAILRLTGSNTFTGNVSVGAGVLEFTTVTNAGGGASALGNGTAITMSGGNLRFIGSTSQSTDRPVTITGSGTLSANGTGGAGITYNGPISITNNANGSLLILSGDPGSNGTIAGGITQTGDATDMTVNGGTWTHRTATSRIADDLTVTGAGTVFNLDSGLLQVRDDFTVTTNAVLNLNGAGVLSFNTATLTSGTLRAIAGGTINLGANDAVVLTEFDELRIGVDGGGAAGVLNLGTFNQTANAFVLGNRHADREGTVIGTGTLTVNGNLDLYEGSISANLASTGTTALEKFGFETVTLSGDNSGLASTGATVIDEGTLVLDYTSSNTTKIRAASALDMRGSQLVLLGNHSAATVQNVASFTMASGGNSVITVTAGTGQQIVLNLNNITRNANSQDGTVRFNLPSGTQSATNGITTDRLNTVGSGTSAILGGWATVNDGTGVFFARNLTNAGNGNIVAAVTTGQDDVALWGSGENISDSAGFSGTLGREFSVNSLRFNAASGSDLLLGTAGHLRVTSGGILVTGNVGDTPSITGGTLDSSSFSLPAGPTSNELIVIQDSASTFEIASDLHIGQNFTKSGAGTVLLSGTNNHTGYTDIQNGVLEVSGGNAIGDQSIVTLSANRNVTLRLRDDETIGRLSGGQRTDSGDTGTVDVGTHTLTLNQSASTTYAGFFTGTGSIVLNTGSTGNLNLQNRSTGFTGSVVVNGGLFQLSNVAQISATSFTINKNGNLLLDNNGTTRFGNRILDTASVTLNSADGAFNGQTRPRGLGIRTDQDATLDETIGVLTLASGASYAALEASTANDDSDLIVNNIVRVSGATFNIRGTNLGGASAQENEFRIGDATNRANFIASLIGGGGAAGSANLSIVPWAIGESLAGALGDANMGNTFLTYDNASGFRPLNFTTEFATFGTAVAGNNVRESLGADLTGLAGASINSLVLNNTAVAGLDVTGGGAGQALDVASGAFLFTVTGGAAGTAYDTTLGGFDDGISVGATNEYVFHVVNPSSAANTATLTATINSSLISLADLTKSGRGTLVLTGTNTAGGGANKTTLNEGILEISDLDNIGGNTGDLVFAGGTLRLGAGFADDISSRAVSFLPGGATFDTNGNDLILANSIGGGGAGAFVKTGAGSLRLNAAASYGGATTVTNGTLVLGVDNAIPAGTPLVLGSGATAGTLDGNGFNQTLGSLSVTTNSTTLASGVVVAAGTTLTVNGPVLLGANAASSTTLFNATGGGSFVQNQVSGTFQVGGATGSTNTNLVTADFSGLADFSVNLGSAGILRVGDNNTNTSGSPNTNSRLILSGGSNSITAGLIGIGDAQGQGGTASLVLGGGSNLIQADTVYIGAASASARASGSLAFAGATGTLTLRGSSGGSSRADVAMTTATTATGFAQVNEFLTAGHSVDLLIDEFVMSERTAGNGSATSTFTFDEGTADITTLAMGRRTGTAGTGGVVANVTLGGGTALIGSLEMAQNTSTTSTGGATATLNISGGNVTIGTGSGTAINMANAGAGRTATSAINLTGGNLSVTGNIVRSEGGGTENATIKVDGGVLDLNGHDVGGATGAITLDARSGTLRNLGELNGGGTLTKSTAGTLVLEGDNNYTGATRITGGILSISSEENLGDNPVAFNAAQLEIDGGTLQTTATFSIDDANRGITVGAAGGTIETSASTSLTIGSANAIVLTGDLSKTGTGALYVNSVSSGTGAITVSEGLLGGTGTLSGATTVQSGASITGGTDGGIGTLSFGGDLTTATGSTWLIDLVQDVNGSSDLINVAGGALNLNSATLSLGLTGDYTVNNTYTIATFNSLAGTFNGLGEGAVVSGYTINYGTVTAGAITLTAVPEPGTLGLLGLALGGFFLRRRKRRSSVVEKE